MASRSRSNESAARRRSARVLIGYNLPWLLWTTYAALLALRPSTGGWPCPVHAVLGWCPSCGLTHAYADLLRGGGAGWWLATILALFLLNAVASLVKARTILTTARPG